MSNIYSSPTGPRLAGLHDKIFIAPPPPSSQPNDEDTDMPTYHSQSENTEVAAFVQDVHFSDMIFHIDHRARNADSHLSSSHHGAMNISARSTRTT